MIKTLRGARLAFARALNKMTALLAEEPYFEAPTFRHQRDLAEVAMRYLDGREFDLANAKLDLAIAHYRVRMAFFAKRDAVEQLRPLTAGYLDPRVPYVAEAQRRVQEAESEHQAAKLRMEAARQTLEALVAK